MVPGHDFSHRTVPGKSRSLLAGEHRYEYKEVCAEFKKSGAAGKTLSTFVVQRREWRLDIEGMNTGQSDKARVARNMIIGGWLVYTEDLGWLF